jgi:hypothetical protein
MRPVASNVRRSVAARSDTCRQVVEDSRIASEMMGRMILSVGIYVGIV